MKRTARARVSIFKQGLTGNPAGSMQEVVVSMHGVEMLEFLD